MNVNRKTTKGGHCVCGKYISKTGKHKGSCTSNSSLTKAENNVKVPRRKATNLNTTTSVNGAYETFISLRENPSQMVAQRTQPGEEVHKGNQTTTTQSCDPVKKQFCPLCRQNMGPNHHRSNLHKHRISCERCQKYIAELPSGGDENANLAALEKLKKCESYEIGKAVRRTNGANFDRAERLYLVALKTENVEELTSAIESMAALDDVNKPKHFKNKTVEELTVFFGNSRASLRERFPGTSFETNDDNRTGKDLFVTASSEWVEIKSSEEKTDGNSGIKVAEKYSQLNDIHILLSPDKRRTLTDPEAVKDSKEETMRQLGEYYRTITDEGKEGLFYYAMAMSYGATKEDEIREFVAHVKDNKPISELKLPTKLMFTATGELVEYGNHFIPGEKYTVTPSSGDDGRPFFTIKGEESKTTAVVLYPNYKNSWFDKANRKKREARDWVSTPCTQTWIRNLESDNT